MFKRFLSWFKKKKATVLVTIVDKAELPFVCYSLQEAELVVFVENEEEAAEVTAIYLDFMLNTNSNINVQTYDTRRRKIVESS